MSRFRRFLLSSISRFCDAWYRRDFLPRQLRFKARVEVLCATGFFDVGGNSSLPKDWNHYVQTH